MPTLEQLTKSFVNTTYFISPVYHARPNPEKALAVARARKNGEVDDEDRVESLDVRLMPPTIYDERDLFKDEWLLQNSVWSRQEDGINIGLIKGTNGVLCQIAEMEIPHYEDSEKIPDFGSLVRSEDKRRLLQEDDYRRLLQIKISPTSGEIPIEVSEVLRREQYEQIDNKHRLLNMVLPFFREAVH